VGGEGHRREQQDDPTGRQRRAGRPQGADAQGQRRPEDKRQLDHRRLQGIGGADGAGVGQERGELTAQAGADRRGGQSDAGGQRDQDGQRRPHRLHPDRDQQHRRHGGAGHQHGRLATAVDQPSEQRTADADPARVDTGDDPGRGERARQMLGMDQKPDAQHLQRQAGEDRGGEQALSAGGQRDREHAAMLGFDWCR
jgi:hypothetical protein